MIDGLMKNIEEMDVKQLTETTNGSAESQHQASKQQHPQKSFLDVTSSSASAVASTMTISEHDSNNVHQQQLFDALSASDGATFDQPTHQQIQYILHNNNQTLPSTASHNTSASNMLSDHLDLQMLLQENHKLASITRVCIHLVDRCRNLNKSKQFTIDLNKLSNMIEAFNENGSTNSTGILPTLSNVGGLIFGNNNGNSQQQPTSTSPVPTTTSRNSTAASTSQAALFPRGSGTVWIHLPNGNTDNLTNSSLITQPFIPQMMSDEQQDAIGKQLNQLVGPKLEKSTKHSHQQTQQDLQLQQQQQAQREAENELNRQQSILFKKLTESGQLLTDLNDPTSKSSAPLGNGALTNGSNPMFSMPLLNEQAQTLFNLVNPMDNSNIENTPSNSNGTKPSKIYKCTICDKAFTSRYNLNRHEKSHSGFQPFECFYLDCKKRFNYGYHLKRHLETHTGERNFVCTWPNCDQRFNRKYNLNRHLWVHTEYKNKQQQQIAMMT